MCFFISCGNYTNTPPPPDINPYMKWKKICVKKMTWEQMQSPVNLFNCFFFIHSWGHGEKQKMLAALIAHATIKGREVFVFCSRWHACSVLNSRDQWRRGCYHSTRSRRSSGGEGGRRDRGVPGGSFWLERGVLCWKARERQAVEANPTGSVRALQQKHLDIPGNICLGKKKEFK